MVNQRSASTNAPYIYIALGVGVLVYLASRLGKRSAENYVPVVSAQVSGNSAMECEAIASRVKQLFREPWFSIGWNEAADVVNELKRIKDKGGAQMVIQAFGNLSAWTAYGEKNGDIFFWITFWLNEENQNRVRPYFYGMAQF